MLDVLKFIFKCIADLINMLFNTDLGFMSLGTFMCVIFIFLPIVATLIGLLKYKMKGD